jgi:hypothetical protein
MTDFPRNFSQKDLELERENHDHYDNLKLSVFKLALVRRKMQLNENEAKNLEEEFKIQMELIHHSRVAILNNITKILGISPAKAKILGLDSIHFSFFPHDSSQEETDVPPPDQL